MNNVYLWELAPDEREAVIKIKEALHRHPELSMQEVKTSELIRTVLEHMDGVRILDIPVKSGVAAIIRGGASGRLIALRADIDALPIREENDPEISSVTEGVMHACGHDFHTAALIGAAQVLARNRAELMGDVMLIFQPGEEILAGAKHMLEAGIFADKKPDFIFGMHNRTDIASGKVVAEAGYRMAGKYNFNIKIKGRAAHGGSPQDAHDPVLCASALVMTLHTILSRNTDPFKTAVLGIEAIHSAETNAVHQMVDEVTLEGSIRTHDELLRKKILGRVREICDSLPVAYGCRALLEVELDMPPVYNSDKMSRIALTAASAAVGIDNIVTAEPSLGCEDFALFMQEVPSYYYWVGSGPEEEEESEPWPGWHDPKFHTDDRGIIPAAHLYINSVLEGQK